MIRQIIKSLKNYFVFAKYIMGKSYKEKKQKKINMKPKKNNKGDRKFTPVDVKNLELIYHLVKERGFTLDGAKKYLKENKHNSISNFEIIRKLEGIKIELLKLKDHL